MHIFISLNLLNKPFLLKAVVFFPLFCWTICIYSNVSMQKQQF